MTTDQARSRVRALVDAEPARADDPAYVMGWLMRLCRSATSRLSAAGVGISILADGAQQLVVAAASSPHYERIEELQFLLGEGPCLEAFASGGPVLVADVAETTRARWQGYGLAVQDLGVRAVFAFPLQVGAARLGAMDVYREEPGPLSATMVNEALTYAEVALGRLLNAHLLQEETADPRESDLLDEERAVVYQAQGVLAVQLGIELREAMARLRAYAYAHNRSLVEVATDVVAHRIVLERDDG